MNVGTFNVLLYSGFFFFKQETKRERDVFVTNRKRNFWGGNYLVLFLLFPREKFFYFFLPLFSSFPLILFTIFWGVFRIQSPVRVYLKKTHKNLLKKKNGGVVHLFILPANPTCRNIGVVRVHSSRGSVHTVPS